MSTTVSAVTSGGVLTVASTAGFAVTESVQLTGTAFGGLVANSTYWIIAQDNTNKTITLSTSLYGGAISIAGGTGTMTLSAYRQSGPGFGNTVTANTTGDYNTLQAIAAKVLGAPTDAAPTYGYNQAVSSSQVTATTSKISQSDWANLGTDLIKARIHQTGNIYEGNNLTFPSTNDAVGEAFRKNYSDFANLVYSNANVVDASQTTIPPSGIASTARGQIWNGDIQSTATLDFGSKPAARAFFNTGGYITVACVLSGSFNSISSLKDNTWSQMFGAMGTIVIGPNSTTKSGGLATSGYTSTTSNIGFFQLTTSPQLLFTETPPSSGSYAANSFKIYGYRDSSSRYVYIQFQFNDDTGVTSGASAVYGGDEYVDGLLTLSLGCRRASGTAVSVNAPSVSFAGDLQDMNGAPALYSLSSSSYYVNEGSTFTVTLQTQNVNEGTNVGYTVSGFSPTPNGVARYSATKANFTISNGKATIDFTINNDLYSDGATAITITLANSLASVTLNVNDTSITPAGEALILSSTNGYGSGIGYYSNSSFTVPPGIYSLNIYMVGGGAGGGAYAGGGGGGGQVRGPLVLGVTPGQQISAIVAGASGGGANGNATQFGSFTALGGSAGSGGSGWTGGTGGSSGNSNGGAVGTSNSSQQVFNFYGGGGGGSNGNGSGNAGGPSTNFALAGKYDNWYLQWGGGGYGGTSATGGAGAGRGAGDANPWPGAGLSGAPNTGNGGAGGDAAPATPHGTTSANAAITGYGGGGGGSGMIVVTWGP